MHPSLLSQSDGRCCSKKSLKTLGSSPIASRTVPRPASLFIMNPAPTLWDIASSGSDSEPLSPLHNGRVCETMLSNQPSKKARTEVDGPNEPQLCGDAEPSSSTWIDRISSVLNLTELRKKFRSKLVLQTACSGTNAVSLALQARRLCNQTPSLKARPFVSSTTQILGVVFLLLTLASHP